jgi:Tfp pilus assembly protein PilV
MPSQRGFTLVEVLVCTLVLIIGLVSIAGLLGVTTSMQFGSRQATTSTRLAQDKIDELMKLNFDTVPAVAVGGNLEGNDVNYFDTPMEAVTRRWQVQAGPTPNTRVLTVRVVNQRAAQYGRQVDLITIIRQW